MLEIEPEVETNLQELSDEWTPKQGENWQEHGYPIYNELCTEASKKWYLALYRPKKRGSGMMERDHVEIGTKEHYLKKKIEALKNPMSSVQGEIMASLGLDKATTDFLDKVAADIVRVTTSGHEKEQILKEAQRLRRIVG